MFKEKFYQYHLEKYLKGHHLVLEIGITDVSNANLHAEIKVWNNWKSAIKQILLYNACSPRSILQIYLFGEPTEKQRILAIKYIKKFNIEIYELKHKNNELIIIQDEKIIDKINLKNESIIKKEYIVKNTDLLFTCKRCDYETDLKQSLIKHLQKKKICPVIKEDIDRSILLNELVYVKEYNDRTFDCEFCAMKFNNSSNKSRHKKICKSAIIDDDKETIKRNLQELQEKFNNLEIKMEIKLKEINNFGNEKTDYVNKDETNVIKLLKSIHFNPDHPENHNIKIKNINKNLLEYYKDGKWIIEKKDRVFEWMINKLNINEKITKSIKDDIIILLLNNK